MKLRSITKLPLGLLVLASVLSISWWLGGAVVVAKSPMEQAFFGLVSIVAMGFGLFFAWMIGDALLGDVDE